MSDSFLLCWMGGIVMKDTWWGGSKGRKREEGAMGLVKDGVFVMAASPQHSQAILCLEDGDVGFFPRKGGSCLWPGNRHKNVPAYLVI